RSAVPPPCHFFSPPPSSSPAPPLMPCHASFRWGEPTGQLVQASCRTPVASTSADHHAWRMTNVMARLSAPAPAKQLTAQGFCTNNDENPTLSRRGGNACPIRTG